MSSPLLSPAIPTDRLSHVVTDALEVSTEPVFAVLRHWHWLMRGQRGQIESRDHRSHWEDIGHSRSAVRQRVHVIGPLDELRLAQNLGLAWPRERIKKRSERHLILTSCHARSKPHRGTTMSSTGSSRSMLTTVGPTEFGYVTRPIPRSASHPPSKLGSRGCDDHSILRLPLRRPRSVVGKDAAMPTSSDSYRRTARTAMTCSCEPARDVGVLRDSDPTSRSRRKAGVAHPPTLRRSTPTRWSQCVTPRRAVPNSP